MRGADKEKEVLCNSCGMKKIGLRIKGWFRFESRAEKINKKKGSSSLARRKVNVHFDHKNWVAFGHATGLRWGVRYGSRIVFVTY